MQVESSLYCQVEGDEALRIVRQRIDRICSNVQSFHLSTQQIICTEQETPLPAHSPKLAGLFYCKSGEDLAQSHFLLSKSAIDLGKGRLADTRNVVKIQLANEQTDQSVFEFFTSLGTMLTDKIETRCSVMKYFGGIEVSISTIDNYLFTIKISIIYDNYSLTSGKEKELLQFCDFFQE